MTAPLIYHLLVSPFGVFVIETTNYGGWIYGSENERTWTHAIHRRNYTFQNPLHQNYNHVKTVQSITGLPPDQIHSLVVFVGKGRFKTSMPPNVITPEGLRRYFFGKSSFEVSDGSDAASGVHNAEELAGLMTVQFAQQIEGVTADIVCPTGLSGQVGGQLTCTGTTSDGWTLTIVVLEHEEGAFRWDITESVPVTTAG